MNVLKKPRVQQAKPSGRDGDDPFNRLLRRMVASIALAMSLLLIVFILLLEMKVIHRPDDPNSIISGFDIGKIHERFEKYSLA